MPVSLPPSSPRCQHLSLPHHRDTSVSPSLFHSLHLPLVPSLTVASYILCSSSISTPPSSPHSCTPMFPLAHFLIYPGCPSPLGPCALSPLLGHCALSCVLSSLFPLPLYLTPVHPHLGSCALSSVISLAPATLSHPFAVNCRK